MHFNKKVKCFHVLINIYYPVCTYLFVYFKNVDIHKENKHDNDQNIKLFIFLKILFRK